jgi:hypothetical protein
MFSPKNNCEKLNKLVAKDALKKIINVVYLIINHTLLINAMFNLLDYVCV